MDSHERVRATALSTIARDIPRGFWVDAGQMSRNVYMDSFHQIAADGQLLDEQRRDALFQLRHFRMEHLLIQLAERHGLARSPTMLTENGRHIAYVGWGDVAMTQTYVPEIGAMPKPAKFRERYARRMGLPRLDLGDEPEQLLIGKELYGLLAHNPVGSRFREDDQKLGMLQFCLPASDCKAWAVELSSSEILQAYGGLDAEMKPDRALPWKAQREKGEAKQ